MSMPQNEFKSWLECCRASARASRLGARSFTDAQLRAAYAAHPVSDDCARALECSKQTLFQHAKRLGLVFKRQPTAAWTAEQDEVIRQCARGEISQTKAVSLTGHSSLTLRARAKVLGVSLPVYSRGGRRVVDSIVKAPRDDYGEGITVRGDKYLARLFDVHVTPRDEVYPGVVVR